MNRQRGKSWLTSTVAIPTEIQGRPIWGAWFDEAPRGDVVWHLEGGQTVVFKATDHSERILSLARHHSPCDTDSDKSPLAANEGDPRR